MRFFLFFFLSWGGGELFGIVAGFLSMSFLCLWLCLCAAPSDFVGCLLGFGLGLAVEWTIEHLSICDPPITVNSGWYDYS
jgi:hypothetical protein